MKLLFIIVLCNLIVGCAELSYPVAIFYLNRDNQLLSTLIEYAEHLADKNSMTTLKNHDLDLNEEVETIFVADGNDWLNRSLSIGKTNHADFSIHMAFSDITVSAHAPLRVSTAKISADKIIEDWKIIFDSEGIQYRLEISEKWPKEDEKIQNK